MDSKVMVVLIVAIVFGAGLLRRYLSDKAKQTAAKSAEGSGEQQARITALEERVAVLERLATDKRERLKEEIDAL